MRRLRPFASAGLVAAVMLQSFSAHGITVARVTRHGYILTDDGNAENNQFGDEIPAGNTRETILFIQEVTAALNNVEGFVEGRFLATMQIPSTQDPLAYYLPIRNDVRGIGIRSSADGRTEVFDNNRVYGTSFTLDGFLYLNSLRFYTDPRAVNFGRYLICTQEFGHRYGTFFTAPPYPDSTLDAGAPEGDASLTDAGPGDASDDAAGDVAATGDAPAGDAAALGDASADASDGAAPALAVDILLGRGNRLANGTIVNRSHWSFFVNSGGSPMEGNAWSELSAGLFRTERPTFRFSDFDLYSMGLMAPAEVRPTFMIAEPRDVPRGYGRESPPTYYNQQVTVRGRRVDLTVDDLIRANGRRNPAFPNTPRALDVVWVLWAPANSVNDALVAEFDEAIESCSLGYDTATGNRGRLNAVVSPNTSPMMDPDGGARPDVTLPVMDDAGFPVDASDAGASGDAARADADAAPVTTRYEARGGCDCNTLPTTHARHEALYLGVMGLAVMLRRRRRGSSR